MEAWAQIHRRRDADANAATSRTHTVDRDGASAIGYTARDIDVDKPVKKPQSIETVHVSRVAWGDATPLVFVGTSDGTLHCYVPSSSAAQLSEHVAPTDLASLRWHTSYRRLAHACAQFLDSWGVFLTLSDSKLALYTLPLPNNPHAESSSSSSSLIKGISMSMSSMNSSSSSIDSSSGGSSDKLLTVIDAAKHTMLFAAHERARVVVSLSKQLTLRVFDWTTSRTLVLRTQHELPQMLLPNLTAALPVQQLIVMGESHVLVVLKRDWCVLNVDSGCVIARQASDTVDNALVTAAVAIPRWRLGVHARSTLQDVVIVTKHNAAVVALAVERDASDSNSSDDADDETIDASRRPDPTSVSDDRVRIVVTRVLTFESAAPRSAVYHHPLLLLEFTDALAVYHIATMHELQRLLLPLTARPLLGAAAVVALDAEPLDTRDMSNAQATLLTLAAAAPFAFQLHTMPRVASLVQNDMTNGRFEDAVALCTLCPDTCGLDATTQRALLVAFGIEQFACGAYRNAMTLFVASDVDVVDVLTTLYPRDLLPRSLHSAHTSASGVLLAAKKLLLLAPAAPRVQTTTTKELTGDALVQSLRALLLLLHHHRDALVHRSHAANDSTWRRPSSGNSSSNADASSMRTLQVIDTVLLKCLVLVSESRSQSSSQSQSSSPSAAMRAKHGLQTLVTQPNWCELSEAESFLRAHQQLDALLQFYATRKEHRKALELLEDLERSASGRERAAAANATNADSGTSSSSTVQALGDLASSAHCMALTTTYLQRLGQRKAELVFEFSRRVLATRPSLGLTIFTDRRVAEAKEDIDPSLVLQHLKSCAFPATTASIDDSSSSGAVTSTTALPLIDPRLVAIEYLTQVILAPKPTLAMPSRLHDEVVYLVLDAISTELQTTARSNTNTSRLTARVTHQRGLVGALRQKLMAFLEADAAAYHPERMLSRTPNEMVDERAALLARLGRHHDVLQLYAIELQDAALAERYCNRCFDAKLADTSIYSALLRLYLRPSVATTATTTTTAAARRSARSPGKRTGSTPPALLRRATTSSSSPTKPLPSNDAVAAAVRVLNTYPERIDVSTALELLPPDVPVATLATFFRRVLECHVERHRNSQVKQQLAKMENFTVRQALAKKRQGSVTIWLSHCCDVCGKKLGTATFVRLPHGALLHYACQSASSS